MLNAEDLLQRFSAHITNCKSAPFVCSTRASFESWFRVELFPVLCELGCPTESIDTDFNYPNSGNKADLCVTSEAEQIVFELKCFVAGAHAHKKVCYPGQTKRLEQLFMTHAIQQALAVTTFYGYSETQMRNYTSVFFESTSWKIAGPFKIVDQYPLRMAVASLP